MDETNPNDNGRQAGLLPAEASFQLAEPVKGGHVSLGPDEPEGNTGGSSGSAGQSEGGPAKSGGIARQAADKAREFAGQGKERATGALGQLSQLLTDAAGQVDEKLGEQYGQYARQAAGNVQGFADRLQNKDVDALLEEVRGFVRQSPAAAIGAAAAVGFVVARLIASGLDQRDA